MSDGPGDEPPWYQAKLPGILRFGIAGLLFVPGVSKFLSYERSVHFFTGLGLPSPDILVLVVGAVELVAAALLVLDRVPEVAALLVIPTMVVAAMTAGPTWQNVGALGAALALFTIETYHATPVEDVRAGFLDE